MEVIKLWTECMKVAKSDIKKKISWYEKWRMQKELGEFLDGKN